MPPEIIVRPEARQEAVDVGDYLRQTASPTTADRWADRIVDTFQFLAQNPGTGEPLNDRRPRLAGVRVGRVEKFPRYVVVCRPFEGGIEILHVMHGARDLRRRI
jgi:plasmid stabilization system protein ParE